MTPSRVGVADVADPSATGVRAARRSDLAVLLEMMGADYAESGYPFDGDRAAACFLQLLEEPGLGAVWVAEAAGVAVGYVVLTLGFSLEYGGRDAFVDDLFVRAGHRRRGVGRRLLEAALAAARGAGVQAVHLEVERANPGAGALYEAMGFADNDRRLLTVRLVHSY